MGFSTTSGLEVTHRNAVWETGTGLPGIWTLVKKSLSFSQRLFTCWGYGFFKMCPPQIKQSKCRCTNFCFYALQTAEPWNTDPCGWSILLAGSFDCHPLRSGQYPGLLYTLQELLGVFVSHSGLCRAKLHTTLRSDSCLGLCKGDQWRLGYDCDRDFCALCLPGHRILYDPKSTNVEFLHDLLAVRLSLIAVIYICFWSKVNFAVKVCTYILLIPKTHCAL